MSWSIRLAAAAATLTLLHAQDGAFGGNRVASWLETGAEIRLRGETGSLRLSGREERSAATYSRLRIGFQATASSWLRLELQVQDARTLTGAADGATAFHDNHLDAEYAYLEAGPGREQGRWRIRAGRQALSFGDERLAGADSSWANRTQRFDAIRVTIRRGRWSWDAFAASPVEIDAQGVDRAGSPERFSGVYGHWSAERADAEPYLFWKRVANERTNLLTPGFRLRGELGHGFDAVMESAVQRGSTGGLASEAWATYHEIGYRLPRRTAAMRVAVSYSQASGDDDPRDGRVGSFNDLHPAGYNGCGFLEPFAWRNIRDLRAGLSWSAGKKWNFSVDGHSYWLATVRDGVYVDEGPFVAYKPSAESARLGARVLVMARRAIGGGEAAFGYAKFVAAEYLRQGVSMSHSAFISLTMRL